MVGSVYTSVKRYVACALGNMQETHDCCPHGHPRSDGDKRYTVKLGSGNESNTPVQEF